MQKDMFMKKVLYIAAAALLLAPACQRENALPDGILTARLADEADGTRTSYDGDISVGNFSWNDGDEIALHYTDGKYHISRITPVAADPKTGTFLCSTTSSVQRNYFAVYPASVVDASNYGNSTLNIVLPASYNIIGTLASDISLAPMVADNATDSDELDFYHVGGLLRITMHDIPEATQRIRVIFDKKVNGTFAVSDPGTDHPSISNATASGGNNIVTFTVAETAMGSTSTPIVMNVPVPCGTYGKVDVEMLDKNGASLSSMAFEITMTFARHHGKKLYVKELDSSYGILQSVDDFTVENSDVMSPASTDFSITVNQYKYGTVNGTAPWKAYFSTVEPEIGDLVSSSWSETPLKDAQGNDWLTLSAYEGDGDANTVTVSVAEAAWITEPYRDLMKAAKRMYDYWQTSSGVTDRDLSTYDFMNGSTNNPAETANCYVIQEHGSYLIPCVYGNGYTGGLARSETYTTSVTGSGSTPVLNHFVNADGAPINNLIIPRDNNLTKSNNLVARVVWQDVQPGYEILKDSDLSYSGATSGTALNCPFIRVNFQQDRMAPGNIVIALYDQDNDKILWSWHLWVTRDPLSEITVLQADRTERTFLNVNLGWTPPISYYGGQSLAREQYVVLVSSDNNEVVDSFRVRQDEYEPENHRCYAYSNTFYEFGRKDPFLPTDGLYDFNRPMSFSPDFPAGGLGEKETPATTSGTGGVSTLGFMIQNPYLQIYNGSAYPAYFNLWNANANTNGDSEIVKTIYDPCPRGFHLPNKYAFTGVTKESNWGSTHTYSAEQVYGEAISLSAENELPSGWAFSTDMTSEHRDFVLYNTGTRGFPSGNNATVQVVCQNGFYITGACQSTSGYFDLVLSNTTVQLNHSGGKRNALSVRPMR